MNEIRIIITMDCEPTTATTHPSATGPRDWAQGERAVRGYSEIARSYGFPVTFFIHPETAMAQAGMFNDLARAGACLGLHMHPWKYSLWRHEGTRYFAHYGGLAESEQCALLQESSALWAEAIGHRPRYFRPGTFSANDAIFKVLAEQGFHGGSCSAPGRVLREMRAIWTGCEPDPHRGNTEFRQARGGLDFCNMPLSADFSALLEGRIGRRMHADLRPDVDWPGDYGVSYTTIARNILTQVQDRVPSVPVMNTISHNMYEYRDPADATCTRFRLMLDALTEACAKADLHPVGATVADITDTVLAHSPREEAFVSARVPCSTRSGRSPRRHPMPGNRA